MRNIRRIVAIAASVAIAAASGWYMQHDAPAGTLLSAANAAPPPASAAPPAEVFAAAPQLPMLLAHPSVREVATTTTALAPALLCGDPTLAVVPLPGALVQVRLAAPCMPLERVEMRMGELAFAVLTDADGGYKATIPALARDVQVQALLPEGAALIATAQLDSIDGYERAALLAGASSALHFIAQPDAELTLLGDLGAEPALLAEIRSVASAANAEPPIVRADLGANTCGGDLDAIVLRTGVADALPITLAMPDCDGIDGAVLVPLPPAPMSLAQAQAD